MKKETVKMRFWGLVIVPLMIIVFKNLYSLTNGALLGIFFGAVNGSMWEQTKVVMLSYLVWSLVEAIGTLGIPSLCRVKNNFAVGCRNILSCDISANLCTRC